MSGDEGTEERIKELEDQVKDLEALIHYFVKASDLRQGIISTLHAAVNQLTCGRKVEGFLESAERMWKELVVLIDREDERRENETKNLDAED